MNEPQHVSEIIPAATRELMKPPPAEPPTRGQVPTLPRLVIDSREKLPLQFAHLPAVAGSLQSADYTIAGLETRFGIERKSCADLVASLGRDRERFARELHRLRGFDFARLLIVGTFAELEAARRGMAMRSILASLAAIEARGIPIVWQPSPEAAALWVERAAFWFYRETVKPLGIRLESPPWAVAVPCAVSTLAKA